MGQQEDEHLFRQRLREGSTTASLQTRALLKRLDTARGFLDVPNSDHHTEDALVETSAHQEQK